MAFAGGISLRLTHKITAIAIVGVAGVILVGGMHMYGEAAMAPYRAAAENARHHLRTQRQDRDRVAGGSARRKEFSASQRREAGRCPGRGHPQRRRRYRTASRQGSGDRQRRSGARDRDHGHLTEAIQCAFRRRRRREAAPRPRRELGPRRPPARLGSRYRGARGQTAPAGSYGHHADHAPARKGFHAAPRRQIWRRDEEPGSGIHRRGRQNGYSGCRQGRTQAEARRLPARLLRLV